MLKLNKALEGIKQGAHLWFKRNAAALTAVGFVPSVVALHSEFPIMVAIFVDNIVAGFDKTATDCYLHTKRNTQSLPRWGRLR